MSWKTVFITGMVLGGLLGGAAYGYLTMVEKMVEREVGALSYADLKLAKGLEFASTCGLNTQASCDTLDYMTHVAPYNVPETGFNVVVADYSMYNQSPVVGPENTLFVGRNLGSQVAGQGYFVQDASVKSQLKL